MTFTKLTLLPFFIPCLHQYYWCNWHSSTNILVLDVSQHQYIGVTMPVAPIGKELLTFSTKTWFRGFFWWLQHQYIGAKWLVAPIYWCVIRTGDMLAAPWLFVWTMPIHSAGESGNGNMYNLGWGPYWIIKEHPAPQWETRTQLLPPSRPLLFLISHYL